MGGRSIVGVRVVAVLILGPWVGLVVFVDESPLSSMKLAGKLSNRDMEVGNRLIVLEVVRLYIVGI